MALEEERDHSQSNTHGSPQSPRPRARRASSEPRSPALRPVLTTIDTDESDEDGNFIEEEEIERGPAETGPHTGPPIDEVEAVFDEVRSHAIRSGHLTLPYAVTPLSDILSIPSMRENPTLHFKYPALLPCTRQSLEVARPSSRTA
jgi:hypothetical protein